MGLMLRATRFLLLICIWTAVLTTIGPVAVMGADHSGYCQSPNPPVKPPRKLLGSEPGTCTPPRG
ncbi:hypothetical protein ACP4OV_009915 [Aristida adscensionis]